MPNIELLEKSTPVAPVRIAALAGCQDLANEVDKKLVKFRKELVAKKKPSQIPQGYSLPSFLVDSEIIRFGTGEGKGHIKESVRGADLFIMVDITNYSLTYKVCGHENHMSPDNHFQELIGREEVVETIQRNCVLNTWVMRIKSDEVGNTHIP